LEVLGPGEVYVDTDLNKMVNRLNHTPIIQEVK